MPRKIPTDAIAKQLKEALASAAIPPQREFLERLEFGAAHSTLFPPSVAATKPMSAERIAAIEELNRSKPAEVASAKAVEARERRQANARLAAERAKIWQFIQRHDSLRPSPSKDHVIRAIENDWDWRGYGGGGESAFAAFRVAIDSLDPDPDNRRRLATAIATIIISRWTIDTEEEVYRAVERSSPEELLTVLLQWFGLHEAPGAKQWNILMGLEAGARGSDASELGKLKRIGARGPTSSELEAAAPLLREIVGKVRDIRAGPLPEPRKYKPMVQPLVVRWNDEVIERTWDGIPLLCEQCWRPVLLRQAAFVKTTRGRLRRERSRFCKSICAKRVNRHS